MSTRNGSQSPLSQGSHAQSDSVTRSPSPQLESDNESAPIERDDADVIEVDDDEEEAEAGSKRKLTSAVWDEFKRVKFNGQIRAKCMYCSKQLSATSTNGTKHLHTHLRGCTLRKIKLNGKTLAQASLRFGRTDAGAVSVENYTFDQETARTELGSMIVLHEYPLSMVDHVGFRRFVAALQPLFRIGTRNTIRSDIMAKYEVERKKAIDYMAGIQSRVAITTDLWTSDNQKRGYMAITAHFIDESWTLRNIIMRFIYVPAPHTAEVIGEHLYESLVEWNLDEKVSAVTLDNCTTNDAVLNEFEKDARPKWVRTAVNLDNHIIVPGLDPAAISAHPDKALEDYVSSLSARPMDHSVPLWEAHVLDFPTAEAAAAVALRVHHSVGDGVSLLSLFIACTRSAADPDALPSIPSARRAGPVYALRRPVSSAAGALDALAALALWVVSLLVLAWHTAVDVVRFFATATSVLGDAPTVLKGEEGTEFRPRRFINRTLSLDDIKFVKNAMSCTVNDVLLGITSSALSRYYFRKTGESESKSITVRSAVLVNLRATPGIQTLASMMESGKDNGARWGNKIGYMLIPFHLASHSDPIDYVRRAAKVARRKKSSMESVFTFWSGDLVLKLFGIKEAAALCYGMFTHTTLSFSNMVGPTEQVLFCGNPIVYIAPGTYGHPHALTVHYQSYMNTVKLVLSVDESQFPDSHRLLDDFAESLRLIREAASPKLEAAQDAAPS